MTVNTLEERQRYIREIKSSFQNPHQSLRYVDMNRSADIPIKKNYFKIKFLIAVAFFAIFLYCDQKQINIYGYSTATFCEKLTTTISLEKVIQTMENML